MRTRIFGILACSLVALVTACGGSDNKTDGSYHGQSIDMSDAVLLPPITDTDGNSLTAVVLESQSDACTLLQGQALNNTSAVSIALGIESPDGLIAPANVAGTYEITGSGFRAPGTKLAALTYAIFGSCGAGTTAVAVSGTVHLSQVTTASNGTLSGLEGTFEVKFDTGEGLSGAFKVGLCAGARLLLGVCR
jgi:hypothetical protein